MISNENLEELRQLKEQQHTTKRATASGAENYLHQTINVLDHGFVRLVDYMGDDAAIVQAARVSYGRGTKSQRDDQGLINYLMRNDHTSPFEMCEIKLHVKMPIFVARQWVRHRTANINEYSGRYSEMEDEFFTPGDGNMRAQSTKNRQGSEGLLSYNDDRHANGEMIWLGSQAFDTYQRLLEMDVSRELARTVLPLSTYTEWYWKIDLHNLLHFLELRMDGHAQEEIRSYAYAIFGIVKDWVPMTTQAFIKYRFGGSRLSTTERRLLQDFVGRAMEAGVRFEPYRDLNMSVTEWGEFIDKVGGETA